MPDNSRIKKWDAIICGSIFFVMGVFGMYYDDTTTPILPYNTENPINTKNSFSQKNFKEKNQTLPINKASSGKWYHYKLNIKTTQSEELYEVEPNGKYIKVKNKKSIKPKIPDGHYEFYAPVKLNSAQQMYNYLKNHYNEIMSKDFDEISYYDDHLDDYYDDPEDEIRFPPEIFETLSD